jgi:hypothetical protein
MEKFEDGEVGFDERKFRKPNSANAVVVKGIFREGKLAKRDVAKQVRQRGFNKKDSVKADLKEEVRKTGAGKTRFWRREIRQTWFLMHSEVPR